MKKLMILAMLCCFFIAAIAQQKNKPVFNSYTGAGIQAGQSDPAITVETINGIRYKKWFSGIGLGYSSYRYRTLPIFAEAKYFMGKQGRFYVNGDVGYHVNVHTTYEEDAWYNGVNYKGGVLLNSGVGIVLQPTRKHSFYFQLDYGLKQVRKVVKEYIYVGALPYNPGEYQYTTYKYDLTTVSLKMGFKF